MRDIAVTARIATTFTKSGELDENAFRHQLERFVDARIMPLIASCGSGEGGALTKEEISTIYRIGVETCKGEVLVGSNQPEQYTAKLSIEQAKIAIAAGVDLVNIYGPFGLHGYRPTDNEYLVYFDHVLAEINYPVSLCPHASLGYSPKPWVLAAIADKYPQVAAIILSGVPGDSYFVDLKAALKRNDVDVYVRYDGSFNTFGMGAFGTDVQEANLIPRTVRSYVDLYAAGKYDEALDTYAKLKMVTKINDKWKPSSARWIKMALRGFKLPGGEGGVRPPYILPGEKDIQQYVSELMTVGLPEIQDMAKAAGLA